MSETQIQMKKSLINQVNNDSAEIFLYGIIGRWMDIDVNYLIKELESMKSAGLKNITFFVNSDGGEVVQGQALWAYLDRSGFDITFIVDGVAASIMAMVMTNPKHQVIMGKYAKLMYHRVQGQVNGNSDDVRSYADMMEKFEADLIDMFNVKTGVEKNRAKKEFFGNTDKWINAEEALQLKLINSIRDSRIVSEPTNLINPHEVFAHYDLELINCLTKEKNMKKIALLLNLAENSSEDAVATAIENLISKNAKNGSELSVKENQISELQNIIADHDKTKVKNLIDSAIAAKKFGEDMRDTYTKMAESNMEMAEKVISNMAGVKPLIDELDKKTVSDDEKSWTWDDYHKISKLENLKATNKQRFADLYRAKFNKEYKF